VIVAKIGAKLRKFLQTQNFINSFFEKTERGELKGNRWKMKDGGGENGGARARVLEDLARNVVEMFRILRNFAAEWN